MVLFLGQSIGVVTESDQLWLNFGKEDLTVSMTVLGIPEGVTAG